MPPTPLYPALAMWFPRIVLETNSSSDHLHRSSARKERCTLTTRAVEGDQKHKCSSSGKGWGDHLTSRLELHLIQTHAGCRGFASFLQVLGRKHSRAFTGRQIQTHALRYRNKVWTTSGREPFNAAVTPTRP